MDLLRFALLAAVVAVVPATLVVAAGPRPREVAGKRSSSPPQTHPAWWGVALTSATITLLALATGTILGADPAAAVVVGLALGATPLLWRPLARGWSVRGLALWALGVDAGVLYLGYVLAWTLGADLPTSGVLAGLALWVLEAFVFLIGLGHLWEFVDVLGRRTWAGDVDPAALSVEQRGHRPFVSLHVPTHNEPPDMVIETLERLLVLDYDDYEVLLVDNNTTDPALWRPVEAFCARHDRLTFIHLENWPGYKSGALNHALTRTDPRAELIGIVDADYHVAPDFLADCAPLFAEDDVAFVQTPQDYRDWDHAPYFRRLYHSYRYFFDVSQRSRAERNGAIFGGTMGLIRRSALEDVGGWDEWCITEDAELSLRMLRAGDRGLHVDRAYGRGVMPLTFEALKRQRFRWCFGGVQILRMHARSLLPGRRTAENQLSAGQRWAYLVGALQWFADLAGLAFTGFLLLGAIDAVTGDGVIVRRLSGLILVGVVALLVLGALRAVALLRRAGGASPGEALGAFGVWLALGWAVALAAARGLFAQEGAFLRTPKVRGELRGRDAVRGNRAEVLLATLCLFVGGVTAVVGLVRAITPASTQPADVVGPAGALAVGLLLLLQGAGYAAAPANSLAAIRADLPEDLRRRRRDALASWARDRAPVRRGGGLLLAGGVALVGLLVVATPTAVPDLADLPDSVAEDEGTVAPDRVPGVELTPADPATEPPTPLEPVTLSPSRGSEPGASPGSASSDDGGGSAGPGAGSDAGAPQPEPGSGAGQGTSTGGGQGGGRGGGQGAGQGSGASSSGGPSQAASPAKPSQAAEPGQARPSQAQGTPGSGRSNAPSDRPGNGNGRATGGGP